MVKSNFIILSMALLMGCATTEPPGIQTVVQRVEIPIAVPCKVEIPVPPVYNFDKLTTDNDIYVKSQALLADRLLSIGYETELSVALNSCVK